MAVTGCHSRSAVTPGDRLTLSHGIAAHKMNVGRWCNTRMRRNLARIRTMKMALACRQPPKGCKHDTDRDSHKPTLNPVRWGVHQTKPDALPLGRRSHLENQQAELIWQRPWETRRQAAVAVFETINGFKKIREVETLDQDVEPLGFQKKGRSSKKSEQLRTLTGPSAAVITRLGCLREKARPRYQNPHGITEFRAEISGPDDRFRPRAGLAESPRIPALPVHRPASRPENRAR